MSLTDAQREAVSCDTGAVITAGAGCGKTYVLTERYLHHLTVDGFSPLEVEAVRLRYTVATDVQRFRFGRHLGAATGLRRSDVTLESCLRG